MFVSYAQNLEDVILWRALQHVGEGFYIDVGANHPEDDSVTKAFYDRGWRGINIEPLKKHIAELAEARPRDINLQCAAGEAEGELELFDTPVRGLATASEDVARRHRDAGLEVSSSRVPVRRLTSICDQYASGEIHFLKVDVEGFEAAVLRGMDFSRFRPWIVVVEATAPNAGDLDTSWEPLVTSAGYRFVYFDGLNRFYVAQEHEELAAAFDTPPNVFDEFVRAEIRYLERQIEEARKAADWHATRAEEEGAWAREQARIAAQESDRATKAEHATEAAIQQAELERARAEEQARRAEKADIWAGEQAQLLAQTDARVKELEHHLAQVYASTSWRLTGPLRYSVGLVATGRMSARRVSTNLLRQIVKKVTSNAALRRRLGRVARRLGVEQRLLPLVWRLVAEESATVATGRSDKPHLRLDPAALPQSPCVPEAMLLALSPSSANSSPLVRLLGHVEGHYSLAIVNRGLAVAIEELAPGCVAFVPWHGDRYTGPTDLPHAQRSRLEPLFDRSLPQADARPTISVVHHFPMLRDPDAADLRLALFFWEETAVPAQTVQLMEESFDAVLVATVFVKRALLNSGCSLPVIVVPIGIDHLIADAEPLIAKLTPSAGRPVRLLHVSSVFERKGADLLLDAYFGQFSASDNVELYIKTFPNPHNRIRAQLAARQTAYPDGPTVIIDESPMDDSALLALYRSAQALVLPTRGEGFNLPAAEAMALGLPVLVTGHGAHADFCTQATAGLIPFHFEQSQSHVRSAGACWVTPHVETLATQMRSLVEAVQRDDIQLEQRRTRAAAHVRSTYRWSAGGRGLLAAADWLLREREQLTGLSRSLKMAVITPWATPCGIAEYSEKLLCAFSRSPDVELAIVCDRRTAPVAGVNSGYRPCWNVDDDDSLVAALGAKEISNADVLLVQHQPSLFNLTAEVTEVMASVAERGVVVLLELHSTLPLLAERRLTERAVAALRRLDRIVVHQPDDMNNLLALGLVDNVMLLPHGVVQPLADISPQREREALGIPQDALVLGGFGFLLAHKGIDTVIEALPMLQKTVGRPVHYVGVHSLLDERSELLLRSYRRRVSELGLDDSVTWITDFRQISECQRLLSAADYLIYPYKATRESASGAVTIGLATLRPVLVSPISIFSDLAGATFSMSSDAAADIVTAVQSLEADPSAAQQIVEQQRSWLADRDWQRLSLQLKGTVTGLRRDRLLRAAVEPRRAQQARPERAGRQLLVDVSELYFRDARTGIQRVVRSVLGALLKQSPHDFSVRPVYGVAGEGYRYTDKFGAHGAAGTQWTQAITDEQLVEVGPGDVFLGLDLSAHLFPEAESWFDAYRAAGAQVHFVVYDIIPLTHPEYTVPGIRDAFDHWLRGLGRQADSLVCISAAVADDVRSWLINHTDSLPLPPVRHFHLGADIENSQPTEGIPDGAPALLDALGGGPTFLVVGTIEPRKGHAQVVAAFDELWRRGSEARLLLVGKEGWMVSEFASTLRGHPELGRRLFWLESASDEYLEQLYCKASCLIAASYAEGFGLPLIEAAHRKVPIIARDIPVFREVAGAHAFYFGATDGKKLADCIEQWLQLQQSGQAPSPAGMNWLTWEESAQRLTSAILGEKQSLDLA